MFIFLFPVPLFVALGRERAIYVTPALFLAGVANVVTGLAWDVPMCVQPMKAIAAIAISGGLSREQVTSAGIWMGGFMTFLGMTNAIEWINRIVPKSVVAGMQLGVGVSLAIHGVQMIAGLSFLSEPDCILLAIFAGVLALYCLRQQNSNTTGQRPPPIGLYLLFVGTILGVTHMILNHSSIIWSWDPVLVWTLGNVSVDDWSKGLWQGAIPQLPLTTLNSVISVCALAHSLFPEKRLRQSTTTGETPNSLDSVLSRQEVAVSVGVLNLLACPFGAMPICHGAGGLAGQYQMGARSGSSIVFLGILKIVLASVAGIAVLEVLDAFPSSILGVMLIMAGHELALTGLTLSLGKDTVSSSHIDGREDIASGQETEDYKDQVAVAVLTAIIILGSKKTHYGAMSGWAAHWIIYASRNTNNWRRIFSGRDRRRNSDLAGIREATNPDLV